MSQNFSDPYQPPTLDGGAMPVGSDVEALRNISFWQRFFSVLGFIGTGLMLLFFVGQIVFGIISRNDPTAIVGAVVGLVVFLALTILLYFIPSMLLGQASTASKAFGEGRISLSEYVVQQKKFWRYTGLVVSIVLVIYLFFLAIIMLVGFAAVSMR